MYASITHTKKNRSESFEQVTITVYGDNRILQMNESTFSLFFFIHAVTYIHLIFIRIDTRISVKVLMRCSQWNEDKEQKKIIIIKPCDCRLLRMSTRMISKTNHMLPEGIRTG